MNQTEGLAWTEVTITPRKHRTNRFGSVALTLRMRSQNPTALRSPQQRIRHRKITFVIPKANIPDVLPTRPLFHQPETETQQFPVPRIAKQPSPAVFRRKRPPANKPSHLRIGPQRRDLIEVRDPMGTQTQTLSLKNGNILRHRNIEA